MDFEKRELYVISMFRIRYKDFDNTYRRTLKGEGRQVAKAGGGVQKYGSSGVFCNII